MSNIIPVRPFGKDPKDLNQTLEDAVEQNQGQSQVPNSISKNPSQSSAQQFSIYEDFDSFTIADVACFGDLYVVRLEKKYLEDREWGFNELCNHAAMYGHGDMKTRGLSMAEYHAIARTLWLHRSNQYEGKENENLRNFLQKMCSENKLITLSETSDIPPNLRRWDGGVLHNVGLINSKYLDGHIIFDNVKASDISGKHNNWEGLIGSCPSFPQGSPHEASEIYQWLTGKDLWIDGCRYEEGDHFPITFQLSDNKFCITARSLSSVRLYSLAADFKKVVPIEKKKSSNGVSIP